ncbi:MAG TPA: VWA domain-containing protein [Candidatus Angelobacter sp.]|nr:VWA domain-containing protein [Candidatus Angelobacter sp.]
MKSLRKSAALVALVLLALALAALLARTPQLGAATPAQQQNPPAKPQQPPPVDIKKTVIQVVVPVIVKDGGGQLVPDLHKEDFRIFEDNVEQRIAAFSAEAYPLSMVVLVDNDLKSKDAEQVTGSLRAVVAGMAAGDEAFVCRFDQFFHPGKGFFTDQDKLLTELKRTRLDEEPSVASPSGPLSETPVINGHSATGDSPNVAGTTMIIKGQSTKALDDAVYAASQLLKDRDPDRKRRKIILLISDGVNNPKVNTNNYDTTIKEVLRNDIAVYGIGVGAAYFNRRFERLAKYAHDSGGDVYYGMKSRAMEEFYSRVTEEARNQYTLAYNPTGTDRGVEHHSIEVRVKREGLNILTREGYYVAGVSR